MATEEKYSNASFGKIFLAFLMVLLLALFIISIQTSTKIKDNNEKKLEEILSSKLDGIISKCFLHNYIRNSCQKIISELHKNGPESKAIPNLVKECEKKENILLKAFFYKNNELKQYVNANEEDLELFTDLFKYLPLNIYDEGFVEAHRKTLDKLVKRFGIGTRLELLKLHKSFFTKFSVGDRKQHFHWDNYDDGTGLFIYTTVVPDLQIRFENILKNMPDKNYGVITRNSKVIKDQENISKNKNSISKENEDNTKDKEIIIPPPGLTEDQTRAAYIKTTKSNKSFVISNDFYWYFQTNRFDDKFCYVVPINNNKYISYDWAGLLQTISIYLFIIVVILYLTSLIKVFPGQKVVEFLDNLSILYRIIGIFSMASIFPVLMTIVIGSSLLSDKQSVIEKNILSESLDAIYNLENQREVLYEKTNLMSEDLREAVKQAYLNKQPINNELFYKYLNKYSISPDLSRLDVRDSDIKTIFTLVDRETQGLAELYDLICRIVLKIHCPNRTNANSIKISPAELVSESVLSTDELGFATLIRKRNKQFIFRVGAFPTLWYWDIYPDLKDGPAFICVTTQVITTFSKHIEAHINSLPLKKDNIQLAVFVNNPHYLDRLLTPYKNLPKEEILDIANTSFDTNKVLFRTISIDGKTFWITAKHEKQINSHVFINLISQKERLSVLEPFKWQIGIIGVFALIISLFGAWFITRLIILPVGDLSKGIMAIRQRNKEFSIPIRRNDEFGELANAFNQVIKDFDELEYGKIIQESLLPSNAPVIKGYDIAYFTISATDLAGDYHDNVILDDGRLSVILGDVSGHGISASLAMAMAKATFNYAKAQKVKFPEEFMDMLNTMFNKELKSKNKLMTLISMVLNPETGEVIFDNAGQSYPAYYSNSTQTCEELKMPSLPLGGMKKRKKKTITKIMEHGDAFIFYTDGIIEASAENGEMFGYERFFSIFTEQMKNKNSAKDSINNIYHAVDNFREAGYRSDDITMIIVKRL